MRAVVVWTHLLDFSARAKELNPREMPGWAYMWQGVPANIWATRIRKNVAHWTQAKELNTARMSIHVTGCPRQYMSNKDTQGCSALDPGQRTKYLTDARMSIYVTGSPRQYMSNKYTQECSALGTKTRVRPSVSRPTRHAVRARRRCSALEGM